MGLSIGDFAKRVGVSHEAIRKGIGSGRVVLSADGTIDEATQVERWHATRAPSKLRGGRPMTASTPEAAQVPGVDDDETPWCAAFVSAVLEEAGIVSARTGWARSYLKWGVKLGAPAVGCIVVFERGPNAGHVGFVVGHDRAGHLMVLAAISRTPSPSSRSKLGATACAAPSMRPPSSPPAGPACRASISIAAR